MRGFEPTVARTARQIEDAQRLRWTVFGEEEGLLEPFQCPGGREIDARDDCSRCIHLMVYAGNDPVGTVRLIEQGDSSGRGDHGLDFESKFTLPAVDTATKLAEVTRFGVKRAYRCKGVAAALFAALKAESASRCITHWLAGANLDTDDPEEAAIAYRLLQRRALFHPELRAQPHSFEWPCRSPRRTRFSEAERERALHDDFRGLQLPPAVSLFATAMGARYLGFPAYDAYFNVFSVPLIACLADLEKTARTSVLAPLDRRHTGVARS